MEHPRQKIWKVGDRKYGTSVTENMKHHTEAMARPRQKIWNTRQKIWNIGDRKYRTSKTENMEHDTKNMKHPRQKIWNIRDRKYGSHPSRILFLTDGLAGLCEELSSQLRRWQSVDLSSSLSSRQIQMTNTKWQIQNYKYKWQIQSHDKDKEKQPTETVTVCWSAIITITATNTIWQIPNDKYKDKYVPNTK